MVLFISLDGILARKGAFFTFSIAPEKVAMDADERNIPYTSVFLQTLDIPNLTITLKVN